MIHLISVHVACFKHLWIIGGQRKQLHYCISTAGIRLAFISRPVISPPNIYWHPELLHSTTNYSILRRLLDFLARSAWMLLCHVFWTVLSLKPDGEHIGEEPQLYSLSSSPTVPCSPRFHYTRALATFKILVGPFSDTWRSIWPFDCSGIPLLPNQGHSVAYVRAQAVSWWMQVI